MVGKLNYSKWDNLELSDDSDVEVHPNIDKKSFIRWKQRDIHEKRDVRKGELASLKAESEINQTLKPMLDAVLQGTQTEGSQYYSREVARLTAGRADRGNKDGPDGPTADDMMLSLLLQINEDTSVKGKQGAELDDGLSKMLKDHQGRLAKRQAEVLESIEKMEEEDRRKITSDGIREGWSSGYVNKEETDASENSAASVSSKGKGKETIIETLNSGGASSGSTDVAKASKKSSAENDDDEDDELPTLLPSMSAFARLPSCLPSLPLSASALPPSFHPMRDVRTEPFDVALQHLSKHKELLREDVNTTDALLVEAFQAQMRGDGNLARKCVEKALLVQYCNKLGRDGVNLFFRRMRETGGKATVVYFNDVLSTYARIADRSKAIQAEQAAGGGGDAAGGQEQIQLVAEDPSTVISFNVPDGPPPEQIELDEELAQKMDVEQVRSLLQSRWDMYEALPQDLKTALQTKSLDEVNKVLGAMNVVEAEDVVGKLDQAGVLSFSSSEVRDETGSGVGGGAA